MARLKGKANTLVDPEAQKLFLVHRDKYALLKKKMDDASNALRTYTKTIKGDGFTVDQIKDAIWLATPEGEAEFKAEIAQRLLAAAYSGADIGDQLSLFLDDNRTPAVDRAYREGQKQAMENKRLETRKYAPDTEQYQAFCDGYHAEQERQIKAGIKKKEDAEPAKGAKPDKAKNKGGKGAAAAPEKRGRGRPAGSGKKADAAPAANGKAKDDAPPRRPRVAPATRASLAAAAEASAPASEEADSFFTKTAGNA